MPEKQFKSEVSLYSLREFQDVSQFISVSLDNGHNPDRPLRFYWSEFWNPRSEKKKKKAKTQNLAITQPGFFYGASGRECRNQVLKLPSVVHYKLQP